MENKKKIIKNLNEIFIGKEKIDLQLHKNFKFKF